MPEVATTTIRKRKRNVVTFGGATVNLSHISRETRMSRPLLSRIFSGQLTGSVDSLVRISKYLDLPLEDVVNALREIREKPHK